MKKIFLAGFVSVFFSACGTFPAGFPASNTYSLEEYYSPVEQFMPCNPDISPEDARPGEQACVRPCVYKKVEELKRGEVACEKPKYQPN